MIGNTLQLPGKAVNTLTAKVNGANFSAIIIGGRYDEGPVGGPEWIRRSWGRGPLHPEDKTHTLVFISINWDIVGEHTYVLTNSNLFPVSIGFTNLFPSEDGDEFEYIEYAKTGELTITHSTETFIAEGSFKFDVDVPQPDGTTQHFEITDGKFYVGPTDKLSRR